MVATNFFDYCIVRIHPASNQIPCFDITVEIVDDFLPVVDIAPSFVLADGNYAYHFKVYTTNGVTIQLKITPIHDHVFHSSDSGIEYSRPGIQFFHMWPDAILLAAIGRLWNLPSDVLTLEAFPFQILTDFSESV